MFSDTCSTLGAVRECGDGGGVGGRVLGHSLPQQNNIHNNNNNSGGGGGGSSGSKNWPSRQPVNCHFCGVRISMAFNLRNHVRRCKLRPNAQQQDGSSGHHQFRDVCAAENISGGSSLTPSSSGTTTTTTHYHHRLSPALPLTSPPSYHTSSSTASTSSLPL